MLNEGRKVYLYDEKARVFEYAYSKFIDDNGDSIHHLWTTDDPNIWNPPFRNKLLLTIGEDGNGLCLPKMGGYTDYSDSYHFMLLTCIALGYIPKGLKPMVDTYII